MIIMGFHKLPRVANYWSSDPYLNVPSITQVMNSKGFKKLVENLHINDNSTAVPKGETGYDKLHKLRPLIDGLQHTISSSYVHPMYLHCI